MKRIVWDVIAICILLIGVLGVVSAQCSDSDGGVNPYVKGQIVGPIGPGEGSNGWDYCYNGEGTPISTTGKYLLEWSCTSSDAADQTIYQCPNGCKDGACVDIGNTLISLLNKASYRSDDGVGSNQSCNEYCQSFGETCVLGQFRVNDNSAYKSEFVRCEFKELGRQTNCVCAKPATQKETIIATLLNRAAYRSDDGVGSNESCDEYCQSFGETCLFSQFRVNDNSAYNSELVRCSFKESGRQTNCVCVSPSADIDREIVNTLNTASYRSDDGVGSNESCNEYCQSFGETCVLGQFRVNDNSAYKSEFVRCEFKESGRQTNCVCAKSNPPLLTPICTPNCNGKQCGDDRCGGSCGICGSGTVCSENGLCLTQITPNETSGPIEIPPIPNNTPISDNNTSTNNNSNQNLVCNGCPLNNKCYPYGFRLNQNYCDSDSSNFIIQKTSNSVCNNNFECDSNLCVNSQCVSGSLWAKFMRWLSHLFGGK